MFANNYRVALVGAGSFEQNTLRTIFKLSSKRKPSYTLDEDAEAWRNADLIIADGEQIALVHALQASLKSNQRAILIGQPAVEGLGWPNVPKPVNWSQMLIVLDEQARALSPLTVPDVQRPPVVNAGTAEAARQVAPVFTLVQGGVTANSSPIDPNTPRVLVVDDNAVVHQYMGRQLAGFNCAVDYAGSGEAALDHVQRNFYKLIFLDVTMQGIDGYATCKQIRGMSSALPVRPTVIMLTGRSGAFDKIRGSMAGCDSYLTKPVDAARLSEVLIKHLGLPQGVPGMARAMNMPDAGAR